MSEAAPSRRVLVHKLNLADEITFTYEATIAEVLPNGLRLDALWTRPSLPLGYTTFETGDHFTEWYFTDRWYNFFEITSPTSVLKGWYCNVTEPAQIGETAITYRDLLLDLWVHPNGETLILDEDEFAAEPALTPDLRQRALDGLAELQRLVRDRVPPFDTLPPTQ